MGYELVAKLGDLSKHTKFNLLHLDFLELIEAVVHRWSKSSEKIAKSRGYHLQFRSFLMDPRLCLFICCKTKLKEIYFSLEKIFVFDKIYIICRKKMFLYEKRVLHWKFVLLKKTFFTEKNVKHIYISFEKHIFIPKIFVLQTKYKSFLNMYSFCKKNFLIIKNVFVKTSLWTQ